MSGDEAMTTFISIVGFVLSLGLLAVLLGALIYGIVVAVEAWQDARDTAHRQQIETERHRIAITQAAVERQLAEQAFLVQREMVRHAAHLHGGSHSTYSAGDSHA